MQQVTPCAIASILLIEVCACLSVFSFHGQECMRNVFRVGGATEDAGPRTSMEKYRDPRCR